MLSYGLIKTSVAPLRKKPSHSSEQVSQLLFGERIHILSDTKEPWVHVRNDWDNYEGWLLQSQILEISPIIHRKNLLFYAGLNAQLFLSGNKGILRLSPGSDLFLLKKNIIEWPNNFNVAFKGKKYNRNKAVFTQENLIYWSRLFLGTPYLWGGRSIYGIDCSGFSQIVFKLLDFRLPRDASQQARMGENIHFLQDAQCGDLAFFDNEEGHINHVGILLNNKTIIHATESAGQVVVDMIDNGGIISSVHNLRTHRLRFVNRYFNL